MSRKIISCPACSARFDVAKYPAGSRVRCGRCSNVLTVPPATDAVADAPQAPQRGAAPPSSKSVGGRDGAPISKPVGRADRGRRTQDVASLTGATAKPDAPVASALGTPASEGRDPLLNRVINAQFRIVRKLGEGGYGAVYEAKDVNLERRIALKIMLPARAASREYVAKFFREARTAAQLSHPNVVAVHGVGFDKDNNVYFLAMEYVDGRTLHDILQERGPLPVEDAVDYIMQSCRGLAAAHERNIIHRDIKPGNLMLTPGGAIKIADFGLAKIYEGEGGAQSTVIGTPYFMPPEQFEGKAKDGRTDIYALGVTFYYMLTLQRAHAGAGPAQILLSVMTKEPVSVLEHRADLPEGIWPIVRRMIDRDADRRYGNCVDVLRDLEQLMGGGADEAEQVYCPSCGVPNLPSSTACSGCQASLLEKCPVCGGEDAAGTKFCGNCGANIPAERAVGVLVDEARQFIGVGRLVRAKEKLLQAQERSPENLGIADALKELEARREQRDAHRDAIRDLVARGRAEDARERLNLALAQFPESVEIGEVAKEVDSAFAEPETTGTISAIAHAVAEARRIEESGRVREALVAWRGVRLLSPSNEDARGGEERTSATVARAETLLEEGTDLVQGGDAESALVKLDEANAMLPGDPVVEGRRREASLLAAELRNELAAIDAELNDGRAETALPRLRALSERYPRSRSVLEALSRAEKAGSEANRGVARERVAKAIATAKAHEKSGQARDAARAWREAATLDPDSTEAVAGVARAERSIAEFEALLGQSRKLLSAGDPEGAERTAGEALAIIAADPAGEAQLARSRTQVETLRHEAERIRTALAREPDDDVLSWARELASNYAGSSLAADVLRETEARCKEVEDKASEKRAGVHIKRAKKLEGDGNLPLALGAWQEALRVAPDHAEAKTAVARITGRFERAKSLADDAARLLEAGDPDAARAAAEESLSLLADQREAAGTLAGARTALDEIDRAAKAFNAVLALDRAEQQHERLKRLAAKYPASAQCAELVGKAEQAIAAAREHARTAKVRAFANDARAALEDGRLADADRAAGEALALDANDAAALAVRAECAERTAAAKARLADGEKALAAQRFAEASAAFVAALEADPSLEAAAAGRAKAQASIQRASAELAAAVERAATATRSNTPAQGVAAWRAVLALDPAHAHATSEIERLTKKIDAARAELARGLASLEAGDPESAVRPLDSAHSVLGTEADEPLAAARERASDISQTVRIIETWLAAPDVSLDDAARDATALLARYPGSGRVRELEGHATSAAAERRRSMAVTQIRRLVRDRRFGEARDLAASLRAKGVTSAELDAAAAQAEQAIAKLDDLRARADSARGVGDLAGARDALKELLVALPDDADVKSRVTEIEETIREVTARRDAAETAQRRGAIAQAVELYREAIALSGSEPELTARIVELEAAAGERTRLFAACEDAIKRGDGRACADGAAALLDQYPDDDDARDLQTTGESLDKMVTALFARAQRQVAAGDRKGAEATVESLLRVAPGHDGATALLRKRATVR